MNIMFIITSLSGGGAERVTVTLASEMCKRHNVYLVAYYKTDSSYTVDDRVHVDYLNISDGKNLIERVSNSIRRSVSLRRLKRKYHIDCSISMLLSPNFENVLSRRNEKVIVSVRNKCSMQHFGINKRINAFTSKHADITVALSKNVMSDQIENFETPSSRITTIYNPCDVGAIIEKSEDTLNDQNFKKIRESTDFLVITAGRLSEQKGQWHMIRAFSQVVESKPNAVLCILGQGSLEGYLKSLIKEYGLENNIFLLGFHSNPYPYLVQADVFLFTSLYEGFGNILLEAMACSLPIVSCDCDAGPRELLAPDSELKHSTEKIEFSEYGILTKVMDGVKRSSTEPLTDSEKQIASALIYLADNAEQINYYRGKSRERIKAFSIDEIAKSWEDLF